MSTVINQDNISCPHCGKEYFNMTISSEPYHFVCGPTAGCGKVFEVPASNIISVDTSTVYVDTSEISRLKEENESLAKENETLEDLEAKATVRVVELEAALSAKEKECEELRESYDAVSKGFDAAKEIIMQSYSLDEIEQAIKLVNTHQCENLRDALKSKKEGNNANM